MAGARADIHKVPAVRTKPILSFISNLDLIQERFLAVTKQLPYRNRNKKAIEGRPSATKCFQIKLACTKSSRCCITQYTIIFCADCSMSVSINAKHIFDILESPCIPEANHISYTVGNIFTQPTHTVTLYGGVYFCTARGATAVNKLIKFFDPCVPHRYGPLNFSPQASEAGKAPQGFPNRPYKHY